jgi:hypothetical protein
MELPTQPKERVRDQAWHLRWPQLALVWRLRRRRAPLQQHLQPYRAGSSLS